MKKYNFKVGDTFVRTKAQRFRKIAMFKDGVYRIVNQNGELINMLNDSDLNSQFRRDYYSQYNSVKPVEKDYEIY